MPRGLPLAVAGSIAAACGRIDFLPLTAPSESGTVAASCGAPASTLKFQDNFDRADSDVVGNGWVETETGQATWSIASSSLKLEASDNLFRPVVAHTFSPQTTGTLRLCFLMDFEQISVERQYAVFVQLGSSAQLVDPLIDRAIGAGLTLKWAGPDTDQAFGGMTDDQGFGWEAGGQTLQLVVLGGANVIGAVLDLDAGTAVIEAGSATSAPVPLGVPDVDTVRLFVNELNDVHIAGLRFDDITLGI